MRRKEFFTYLFLYLFLLCTVGPLDALPPEDIASFETITSQTVTGEDLASPYTITGENLVNIIRGMINFDVPGASIIFNRRTGQIFIKHTPTNHLMVENIIENLRSARLKQVEIEARLVTVEATDFKGLGIDFGGADFTTTYNAHSLGTEVPRDTNTNNTFVDFGSFVNALDDSTYGGQYSFYTLGDTFEIQAFIDALESRTEVNTLAAPKLTVFNNQRAHLKIEKRQNFVSEIDANFDTINTAGSTLAWFQLEAVVKQAQSGTILDVTPTINSDGTIGLELHPNYVTADISSNTQNFTNINNSTEFTNPVVLPIFVSQSIDTYLTIPNGGVAVLGGLVSEQETKVNRKVPLLGDLPWVGETLFSNNQETETKQYLLIFIKAKVKEPRA